MNDRNRERFGALYRKGESLLQQLMEFRDTWTPFVVLGTINLDELCQIHLNTRDDWDRNFKACKQFSQQIARIPSNECRIDCFVINTSPIRSDIEFIGRKYWETLAYSLRASIVRDISVLQDFLNNSSQLMESMPSMEENVIEEVSEKCNQIVLEMPRVCTSCWNNNEPLLISSCRS